MNPTNISWCTHTWNVLTGCKRSCNFCYAADLHEKRRNAYLEGKLRNMIQYSVPFTEIMYHEKRLHDPMLKRKKPMTIFVGSMSDHQYWEYKHLNSILFKAWQFPQHTFMFLTKDIQAYIRWPKVPDNVMKGLTFKKIEEDYHQENLEILGSFKNPFVSLEPLMGYVNFKCPDNIKLFIVGAMTPTKKNPDIVVPQKQWIQSIIDNVPAKKIHWKPNILPYIKEYGININFNNNPVVG